MINGCNKMKKVRGDYIIRWRWRIMRILPISRSGTGRNDGIDYEGEH